MPKRARSNANSKRFTKRTRSRSSGRKRVVGSVPKMLSTRPTPNGATNLYSLTPGVTHMLSPSVTTMFRYAELDTLLVTNSATNIVVFRANSCYDPYYGLGGHQPRYYDQLCNSSMYTTCLVTHVDYFFEIRAQSIPTGDRPTLVVLHANPSIPLAPASLVDLAAMAELPFSQSTMSDFSNPTKLKGTVDIAQVLGVSPTELRTNVAYRHAYTTNPVNECMLELGLLIPSATGASVETYISTVLRYHVILYDRATVAPS